MLRFPASLKIPVNLKTFVVTSLLFSLTCFSLFAFQEILAEPKSLNLEAERHWETYEVGGTCIPGGNNMFLVDYDEDGLTEIITGGFTYDVENDVRTFNGASFKAWSWDDQSLTEEESYRYGGGSITCVRAGDADGDGKNEVITGGRFVNSTSAYAQLQIWSFEGTNLIVRTSSELEHSRLTSICISDVNKDGQPEILTSGRSYGELVTEAQLQIWQWDGVTITLREVESWCASQAASANSVEASDLDNDGLVEIVTCGYDNDLKNSSGQLRIWQWNGQELSLKEKVEWRLMENVCALNIAGNEMGNTICKDLDIADVDDDGVPEIVTVGFTYDNITVKGQLRIWNWKSQTLVLEESREWGNADVTDIESLSLNDVDGDGELEIVTSGATGNATVWPEPSHSFGEIKVWCWEENNLSLENSQEWIFGEAAAARNVVTGDIDNDGVMEIVTVGCIFVSASAPAALCDPDMRIWSISNASSPDSTNLPSFIVFGVIVLATFMILGAAILPTYLFMKRRKQGSPETVFVGSEVKARLRNLGSGRLELVGNSLKFHREKGYFKKRKELAREIPLTDIENVERIGNELNIKWKGDTDIFTIEETEIVGIIHERITEACKHHRFEPTLRWKHLPK